MEINDMLLASIDDLNVRFHRATIYFSSGCAPIAVQQKY
jgi:hypothetical protein